MHTRRWIAEWIWERPLDSKGETIVVLDDDRPGILVGYGTWKHVDHIGSVEHPRHIEIMWFAIHSDYQSTFYHDVSDDSGLRDDPQGASHTAMEARAKPGTTIAEVVYAEVERFALEHRDSTARMPITLACHVDNDRGLRFWRKLGFELIPNPKLQVDKDVYYRLVR